MFIIRPLITAKLDVLQTIMYEIFYVVFSHAQITPIYFVIIYCKLSGPQHLVTHGMSVECNESSMEVSFDRLLYPWMDSRNLHMHLKDPNCDSYSVVGKWLTITAPLDGCGTKAIHDGDVIKYVNTFVCHIPPEPDRVISRVPDVWFPFNCTYGRGEPLTSVDVIPSGTLP